MAENDELHPSTVVTIQTLVVFSCIVISRSWTIFPALKSCCDVVHCSQLSLRGINGEFFHKNKCLQRLKKFMSFCLAFQAGFKYHITLN